MISPLYFTVDADTLYGVAHEPDIDKAPGRCVIILSGPGSNRCGPHRFHFQISRHLEENGIRSFRFDFRGRGESTGDSTAINVHSMIEDLMGFIDYMAATRPDITQCVVIANCLSCVPAIKALEAIPFVSSCILLGAQELHDNRIWGTRLAELMTTARKYLVKVGRRSTWTRLLRNQVSYRGISHSFADTLPSQYLTKDKVYKKAIVDRLRLLKPSEPVSKSICCIYGGNDPLRKEIDYYHRFASRHNWTFDAFVIPGADRNFRDPLSGRQVLTYIHRFTLLYTQNPAYVKR